jgi:glyceraldehyde 3-phosphate dehydrogenase
MSTVKVAINGFGRIGRLVFRQIYNMEGIEVVAINDLTSPKVLAHLLKYDSAQGRFEVPVTATEDSIVVAGDTVKIYAQKDPAQIPWGTHGVDVVFVCSGTTNCLAPMAQTLHSKFTILAGLMTTIHAYTNDQNTLDAPHPKGDLRRARAAAANIVPNSTGAAKAIGLVLPELKGKLDGGAQRVPVITGSSTELVTTLAKKVTVEEVNAAMKAAANESFGYTEDELVSSDIIGIRFGSLFDATQTKVITNGDTQMVKTVSWYDNEMSYVSQLVRTVKFFAGLISK